MQMRELTPASQLAALHVLYERGFQLAQQLVPELDLPFVSAVSRVEGEPPLFLSTIARDRYTACFRLTYALDETLSPDLHIKVYRDARVAEALQCASRPPWPTSDSGEADALQFLSAQWRRNAMMVKWLAFLLERGHGFVHASRPRVS